MVGGEKRSERGRGGRSSGGGGMKGDSPAVDGGGMVTGAAEEVHGAFHKIRAAA